MKVCPRCGRTEKEVPFIGFLCRDCYLETNDVVRVSPLLLKRCPTCGKIYAGRWQEYSLEAVRSWIRKHVKTDVHNAFVSVGFASAQGEGIAATILVAGDVDGVPVRIAKSLQIPVAREQCPDCARRAGGYYEAVIQVRGEKVDEAVDLLRRWVGRSGGKGAYITREVRRKEGVDVYIGSRKLAEKLAAKLAKTFDGQVKRSYTLVTEKNGRKIYRVTLAVRV